MRRILIAFALTTTIASAQAGMSGTPPTASHPESHVALVAPPPPPPAGAPAEVQRNYAGVKKNILASADKMPADDLYFKPKPDVRTFARVLNHVSEAQLRVCGAVNGTPQDKLARVPAETAPKTEIVAALNASFAECDKAYASLTPANLTDPITLGPIGTRTRIGALWGNASHDNEQYATLALYLRLKDIAPPSSEK